MVWQLDEPIADPASLNIKFISEYAKSQDKSSLFNQEMMILFQDIEDHVALEKQLSAGLDTKMKTLKFINNS